MKERFAHEPEPLTLSSYYLNLRGRVNQRKEEEGRKEEIKLNESLQWINREKGESTFPIIPLHERKWMKEMRLKLKPGLFFFTDIPWTWQETKHSWSWTTKLDRTVRKEEGQAQSPYGFIASLLSHLVELFVELLHHLSVKLLSSGTYSLSVSSLCFSFLSCL